MKKTIKKIRQFKRSANFSVYIVECADGSYYTGYTNNLENRLKLHNSGKGAKYVAYKLPAKLVYAKSYRYYKLAMQAEKYIKKLTRKQKENLVEGLVMKISSSRKSKFKRTSQKM